MQGAVQPTLFIDNASPEGAVVMVIPVDTGYTVVLVLADVPLYEAVICTVVVVVTVAGSRPNVATDCP